MNPLDEGRNLLGEIRRSLQEHSVGLRDEIQRIHARLDVAHDKLNTALVAVSHLIQRDANMPDHASILADLKAFDADLDTKTNAAVAEFNGFVATHTAVNDSMSDIAAIVSGLPAKLDRLDVIKEPAAEGVNEAEKPAVPTVSVGSGSTTATTTDGSVTTLLHADGSASTVDSSGMSVATDGLAAQAATDAARAAGVTVPTA